MGYVLDILCAIYPPNDDCEIQQEAGFLVYIITCS